MGRISENEVNYFERSEVSNSDLLEVFRRINSIKELPQKALEFGTLLDAMITEPQNLNRLTRTVKSTGLRYSKEDFVKASDMFTKFKSNAFAAKILQTFETQVIFTKELTVNYEGFEFEFDARCKYDFWNDSLKFGADLKSTAAKTMAEFKDSIRFLRVDQSRAFYMDISGANVDYLIGVSKAAPYPVFCLKIERGDAVYKAGKRRYSELSYFKYMGL